MTEDTTPTLVEQAIDRVYRRAKRPRDAHNDARATFRREDRVHRALAAIGDGDEVKIIIRAHVAPAFGDGRGDRVGAEAFLEGIGRD